MDNEDIFLFVYNNALLGACAKLSVCLLERILNLQQRCRYRVAANKLLALRIVSEILQSVLRTLSDLFGSSISDDIS